MTRNSSNATEDAYCIADCQESAHEYAERIERCEQVRRAIGRLNSTFRVILVLRECDGLDYESIARVLNINVGTVQSRLSRAREQLGKELQAFVLPELLSAKTNTVAEASSKKMCC